MNPVYIIFLDDPTEDSSEIAIYDTQLNQTGPATPECALRYLINEPDRCRAVHFSYEEPHNLSVQNLDAIEEFWVMCSEGYDITIDDFRKVYNIIVSEVD